MSKQPLVPPFGDSIKLADFAADYTGGVSRQEALALIPSLRTRLNELQDEVYAGKQHAVLVLLQAIDTGGKDGTIKSVFQEVGPLGCSVTSFGVPTPEELAHDYLWRYRQPMPERGQLVIFNRSYYESVLVERVREIAPNDIWKRRYEEINTLEAYLAREGTVVLKFFLHISNGEQRERLQARIDDPRKRWKFELGDLDDRKRWDSYQDAFQDMINRCNTKAAPWHIVPADHKWYRDVTVAGAIIKRLEGLEMEFPKAAPGVEGLRVK
ncbi:MAG: PPK2 family polyphosphate kinase [Tepidiformaceae bacterium]